MSHAPARAQQRRGPQRLPRRDALIDKPRATSTPPSPATSRAARTAATATDPSANPAAPPTDIPKTRGVTSTKLRAVLRGDLDNIVMLALRKEPARRYVSVEQFVADITRYLEGMPVRARRDCRATAPRSSSGVTASP